MKIATIALAATAALLVASPAAASTARHVAIGDLDLATPHGQAALAKRIDRAAWQVCLFDESGTLRSPDRQTACARDAQQDIAAQVAVLKTHEQFARR